VNDSVAPKKKRLLLIVRMLGCLCAQPKKQGAISPPWSFRLRRGSRLFKRLWARSATGIRMRFPFRVIRVISGLH